MEVYIVVVPNITQKEMKEFLDECVGGETILTTKEKEIGDIYVSFIVTDYLELSFVTKEFMDIYNEEETDLEDQYVEGDIEE